MSAVSADAFARAETRRMRAQAWWVIAVAVALAALPAVIRSEFQITFLTLALYSALLGQAWNILGGFGGQYSFGHSVFFGVGAYATAIAQVHFALNPWVGLALGVALGALVGAGMGALSFRYGLRGSYFALVTLAFAEVFRIGANSVDFTGAGVGMMLELKPGAANFQFAAKAGFYYVILAFTVVSLIVAWWLRHGRYGAYLMAVRDNEDAARALGIDSYRIKVAATALSAALMSAGGVFYMQYFHYIDPSLAFGPAVSVEALLVAIVGGAGSIFGPLLAALALAALGQLTSGVIGRAPQLSMSLYGLLLILVVTFLPGGLAGIAQRWRVAR